VERRLELALLAAARQAAQPQPSWSAIVLKAYAFVVAARPELRRAYLPLPTPHLYEHPTGVASVTVERPFGDETAVFFGHIACPETLSLVELDARLRALQEEPLERCGCFRRALRFSRLPRPVRRLVWWLGLNWSGSRRARSLGTYGFTVPSDHRAASLHTLSPLTTTLNYRVPAADGSAVVRLVYDHRVLDEGTAARALEDLKRVLLGEILNELRYLRSVEAA
jgi:hypothetical protein